MDTDDDKRTPEAWADRVWTVGTATRLDADHCALAAELFGRVADDPEQAAHLIAALVQQN